VEHLPWRVTTTKQVSADLLNIVFLGNETQVKTAFQQAGWRSSDPASRQAFFKNMYALLNNSGYAQQPMMTFLLNGKPEDMNWQKSLNSYGRRDHLRIWQWTPEGASEPVWLSSSTHDTSAVLAVKYRGFVHHIAPAIDEERAAVIRDLRFAGCVKSVSYVARPEVPTATKNAIGDTMHTDGAVAVVALQDCQHPDAAPDMDGRAEKYRPGNHVFRFARRQILTFRNDMLRANIIYGAFDGGRMMWAALRKPPAMPAQ